MYSYGWREYMPDIGRWNGIDQLAENYLSTSTYTYVANNPVLRFDVDGRWFNDDGTINTSGHTPGFVSGHQYLNSFLGANNSNSGGGNSAYTFTGNNAISLFNYFKNGGSMNGISINKGYINYWSSSPGFVTIDENGEKETNIGEMINHTIKLSAYDRSFLEDYYEGFRYADKSNLKAGSAWTGYAGFVTTKYEKLFHYTANISSTLGDKAGALKGARGFAVAGKFLGGIGVLLAVKEDYEQNGKLGVGTAVKVGIGLATTFAAGALAPWALGYVIADVVVGITTGTTITDRIAAGIENTAFGQLD